MRLRIFISAVVGLGSGIFCWFLLRHFQLGAGDFKWALWEARALLAHGNPWEWRDQFYPLTTALFGFPFLRTSPEIAGGIFYGTSSALLAFGLTRHGYRRLLIFLAYPYWAGILTVQWAPLIMAGALFPLLLPASLAKPQVGLPVALTHLSRRGFVGCTLLLLLSLIVMPNWLWLWVAHIGNYSRFIPLLVLPGPLIALALLRYRRRDAWLLLLMAAMPQRWFYDAFVLWLIPKTRREILATVFFSWGAGVWRWYHIPHSFVQAGRWAVVCFYLPMLVVVLARGGEPALDEPAAEV